MTAKEKREAYARIENGEVQIIIGTHALIQDKVNYKELALVVTDEQHRFGVRQRERFSEKGEIPHVLVMSATPIPRTLAIIVYGDLDISVIDELPSNRLPIKNCVVDTSYRETAYRFMKKQVAEGRQCYIICPMVEESEHLEVENVIDYTAMLSEELGSDITVAYLHGKMKQAQKDEIMERFDRNEIQILVSTTVIEVGIDDVVRYSLRIGRPLPDLLLGTVPFRRVDTVPHGRKKPYSADGYGNTYREIPVFIASAVQIKVYRHILHEIVTHKYKHTFP